ncbi:MAG: 7TM diverse intracellular signaling domain-containing protein, partial [Bacteroidota bacterium]
MKLPNSKTRRGILVLTALLIISLSAVLVSRALGFSQTGVMKVGSLRQTLSSTSTSGPVVLTDGQGEYPLGLHMNILEDPSRALTIDQVSSPAYETQFIPSQSESPNYGFTDSVYWVRLDLENGTRKANGWLLEVDFANMHYVDLYTPLPDGNGFEVKQTGILRPVSTRDLIYPQIVFNLSVPALGRQTLYLRFQSGASMALALTLRTTTAFMIQSQWQHLSSGLFFGILIGLLVYNLFLLFSLRDVNYLYFVIEIAATIFLVSSFDGYMQIYLLPNPHALTQYYIPLSFSIIFLSIVLFADSFLEIKTQLPKLHFVNVTILVVWGVLVLLIPFTSYHFFTNLVSRWALVSLIVVLIDGVTCLLRGFRPARLFLIAWAGLLVSLIILLLVLLGDISNSILTVNLFRFGLIWQGVCWSMALADRINLLKAETENANHELRTGARRLSQILEGMPLGVVLYGNNHKPQYINQRSVELFTNPARGIRPDLSAERTLEEAIHYFSLKEASKGEEYPLENFPPYNALHGAATYVDDLEVDQGDRRVPLEVWASPIMDDQGNVESAVVAFQDITRRKQSEAALEEYRRHLET